ncbi:ATP-binding protein involved in chromosome partitioning [Elusimicrobium posterum]|uniref:P-loop NTPase n=1 Tax=Elusimicrobium posterum TaxID=3116653 RepID=UPI003C7091A0
MDIQLNLDPRPFAINARLKNVKKIFAVSGFKGGVGKTSVACMLALMLAEEGFRTGLADLDFGGASCHTVLGVNPGPDSLFPDEIEGLSPPFVDKVRFMSIAYFTQKRTVHLRGSDISNAVVEMLSVTNWGDLDYLILDMPPGMSDTALDIMRYAPQAEVLCVITPSVLSQNLAATNLEFLSHSKIKISGVIENMFEDKPAPFSHFPVVSILPKDEGYESALGDTEKIKKTQVYAKLKEDINKFIEK